MKALVTYFSKTGHTEAAAKDIARGLTESGVEVEVKKVSEADPETVSGYDVVVVGSPTYGNTRYQAAAKPVENFFSSLRPMSLEGRVAGAFSVNAGYGGGKIVAAIEKRLASLGAAVVTGGPVQKAGAPLSLWKGPDAKQTDVDKAVDFGKRLAAACPRAT